MANKERAALWTNGIGHVWIANEENVLAVGHSHGRAALDAARIGSGERVLDVGCGTGPMTRAIADLVVSTGSVVGLDISSVLIEEAKLRAAGRDNVSFVCADAQTVDLDPSFDVVYSQFGVMFFEDPAAAFANLRSALTPGGRLAFACWQGFFANAWMSVPAMGAMSVLQAPPPDPTAPGPFTLEDPDRIRSLLTDAGLTDIDVRPFEDVAVLRWDLEGIGHMFKLSPMREQWEQADEATRERVIVAVREAGAPYRQEDGTYGLPSASWTVTARGVASC
jgi:SAM-dependent methyltransferase